jgi:hypothetical protein
MDRSRRNIHKINYANLARGQRDAELSDDEERITQLEEEVDSASEDEASEVEDVVEILSEVSLE